MTSPDTGSSRSSSDDPASTEGGRRTASDARTSALPRSTLFWVCIVTAVLLVVVGAVIRTGVMAGVLGLWGVSLFAFTLVGYGAYQVWYGSGF